MALHPSARLFLSPLLTRPSLAPVGYTPRHLFTTSSTAQAKKGEDKGEINTSHIENTRSGTDDQSAREEQAAFSPRTTDPGEERKVAGKEAGKEGNPLDVSPANPDVSKMRVPDEGGPAKSPNEGNVDKKSKFGSPQKKGK